MDWLNHHDLGLWDLTSVLWLWQGQSGEMCSSETDRQLLQLGSSGIELSSENNMSELMTWSLCVTSSDDLPNLYLHLYSPSLISQIFKSLTWSRSHHQTSIITVILSSWPGNSPYGQIFIASFRIQIYTRTDYIAGGYEDIMLKRGFLAFNFETKNDTSSPGKRGRV